MSCDRNYGINIPTCSGHGQCVDNICYCYSGWTSIADFQSDYGYDCDINLLLIKVLAWFSLTFNIIGFFSSLLNLNFYEKWNSNRNIIMLSLVGATIPCIILSILRIIDSQKYIIGTNNIFPVSVIAFLTFSGCISLYFCTEAMIKFLKTNVKFLSSETKEKVSIKFNLRSKFSQFCILLSILQLVTTPITLATNNLISNAISQFSSILLNNYMVFNLFSVLNVFLMEIKSYIKESSNKMVNLNDVKTVERKLNIARNIYFFFITPFPLAIIFSFWSYLGRKTTYLISGNLISVCMFAICGNIIFGKLKLSLIIPANTTQVQDNWTREELYIKEEKEELAV